MSRYTESFKRYLVESWYYDTRLLKTIGIKNRGITCPGVIVLDKEGKDASVVQAFAIMSDETRTQHRLYPFYRTQNWGKNNGTVYPSCSIATCDSDGKWTIYDAHDATKKRDEDYLTHSLAVERFNRRIDVKAIQDIGKGLRLTCWIMAGLICAYYFIGLISPHIELPLDGSVVSLFILVAVLILLPLLIPYLEGISFFGIDLFLKND